MGFQLPTSTGERWDFWTINRSFIFLQVCVWWKFSRNKNLGIVPKLVMVHEAQKNTPQTDTPENFGT